MSSEENDDEMSLLDEIDREILMHREAHFSGSFPAMLEYYRKGGKGVNLDLPLERIKELETLEKMQGKNLAAFYLSPEDVEKIALSRTLYKKLKSLYDKPKENSIPRLIADMILTENADPQEEMQAIIAKGTQVAPALVDLLSSVEFHDPLFPGYGIAPQLAAQCLGKIGDKRAIIGLFESIGKEDMINEEISLDALAAIGAPAIEFLLRVLKSKPINFDNERAAIALIHFQNNATIAKHFLSLLTDPTFKKSLPLANYLALGCEGLVDEEDKREVENLEKDPETPTSVKQDLAFVRAAWRSLPKA